MSTLFAWLVLADERSRFAEEWDANLVHAPELGVLSVEVVHAARRAAMRMRVRRMTDTLSGRRGPLRCAAWWLLVVVAGVVLPIGTGLTLLAMGSCQVLMVSSRRSRVLGPALGLQVLGLGVAAVLWNVGFDRADAGLAEPAWVAWWLPSLGLGVVSLVVFWVVALAGSRRVPRDPVRRVAG